LFFFSRLLSLEPCRLFGELIEEKEATKSIQ